jgi:hypothetical protein
MQDELESGWHTSIAERWGVDALDDVDRVLDQQAVRSSVGWEAGCHAENELFTRVRHGTPIGEFLRPLGVVP